MSAPATAGTTAGTTVALAALLVLSAHAGVVALAAAVALLGVLLASGWAALLALPTPRGSAGVIAAAALAAAAVVAVEAATAGTAGPGGLLARLPVTMAIALLAAFGHQLLRRDGRPRLVESVTAVVTGQAFVIGAAAWVALPAAANGRPFLAGAAAAVAAATLACAVRLPLRIAGPLAVAVAVLVGGGVLALVWALAAGPDDAVLPRAHLLAGALVGLLAGVVTATWRALVAPLPAVGSRRAVLAVAAAPVALCGPGAYVLARVLLA
ncbi:hypothetical protein CLV92_11723 [Kineococcus xinjiangensis]|uniref:Uncharacterized protein n=1 Tax=Kineococcus xinjiangensis TaxID=512762 RepID=A0A2S6ID19_9ACTN|nr:hypothetical protein [Kineococcus xinjiangensis]PPK92060.1 hypothetical protein CLV92_11723 [Kineococcus xinjiangensis]